MNGRKFSICCHSAAEKQVPHPETWISPVCANWVFCWVLHPDYPHNSCYPLPLNLLSIGILIVFNTTLLSLFMTTLFIFLNGIKWLGSNLIHKDISCTDFADPRVTIKLHFGFLHSDFGCIYKESTALFFNLFKPFNLLISQQFVNVN